MFDLSMIDKAKNIFSSGGGNAWNRIGNAADLMQSAGGGGGGTAPPPRAGNEPNPNANPTSTGEAIQGITNSPGAQGLKKVAGAVASFYTGGLAGLAMNVGSSAIGGNKAAAQRADDMETEDALKGLSSMSFRR